MAKKPDLYVATSTGTVKVEGKNVNYASGRTLVRAGHPILVAAPNRFRPVEGILEAPAKAPVRAEIKVEPKAKAEGKSKSDGDK